MEALKNEILDPTVLLPGGSRVERTTLETPEQALVHIKAHRVRGLMLYSTCVSLVGAALVWLVLGGDTFARDVHASALIGSALVTGTYAIAFRNPHRYRQTIAGAIILGHLPVMFTGFYYWGNFSSYVAVIPLTIFIAADASESKWPALAAAAIGIIAMSAFSLAMVFDAIEIRALTDAVRAPLATELVAVGLIAIISAGAVALGRAGGHRRRLVLAEHNRALRALAQREAQLAEAQLDLAAARAADEGKPGRFTGQTLDDKFELGEVLGRGAMGEVYAATRVADGHPCAVKLLAGHLLRDAAAYERFHRETRMLQTLESEHVVHVLAVSSPDARQPYLAMERLVGIDLAQLLEQHDKLSLAAIADIIKQVGAGLDAVHRAGVIHRDLKPRNVFGTGPETARTWKIIDFGIGKWVDRERDHADGDGDGVGDGSLTMDNVLGTPGYMSPEQALGEAIDARSDIYALGVLLYRMITGVPAVRLREPPAMLHEVVYRVPTKPGAITSVPPQVEAVLAIALAKLPADRFASAGELASTFETAVGARLDRSVGHRAARIIGKMPWGSEIQRDALR